MNFEQLLGNVLGRAAQGRRPNDPITRQYMDMLRRFGEHALTQWSAISGTGMTCSISGFQGGQRRSCPAAAAGPCIGCGRLVCLMHSMASVDDGSLFCKACVQTHVGAPAGSEAGPGPGADARAEEPHESEEEILRNKYLSVMGLGPEATAEDIKRRFKELSLRYHPDRNRHVSGPERSRLEAQYKAITQAYHWLMEHERGAA